MTTVTEGEVSGAITAPAVRLLYDRVLIRPIEAPTEHAGLHIPEVAREVPKEGTVVAVAGGILTDSGTLVPIPLTVGERVTFGQYSGTSVEIDGQRLISIHARDIIAVLG